MLRGILFDLDGTLCDHDGAVRAALRIWLPSIGRAATAETVAHWDEVQEHHLAAWRRREITFAEQRRRRLRDFLPFAPAADAELDAVFAGYLRAYESSYRAFDDARPALIAVAAAGLEVAVLTNGARDQQNDKLARTGLADLAGPVFTVDDLNVAKPDPVAFRLACVRWGLPPSAVLSVGDRHDLDVVPARAAGLQAVHLDRSAPPGPDRISTLLALPVAR